jgi:hypothetical protein
MKKKRNTFITVTTLSLSVLIFGYSIFTNSAGDKRRYQTNSLPFVYRVNNSVTDFPGWQNAIWKGANQWNEVESAFFAFVEGSLTSANSRTRDGINLVYFDNNYDNFAPGSNIIAFSATFQSGSWAVESDLIWNAAGFPPGIDGESDRQDMQSVIAHEFGHHLGLGHTGDAGNDQPGAGEVIREAVMYWASSDGDTANRVLNIDDVMAVTSVYPRIYFTGSVLDGDGQPIEGVTYSVSENTTASYVVDPILIWGWQMGGYVGNTNMPPDSDGNFTFYTTSYNFEVTFAALDYAPETVSIEMGETTSLIEEEVELNIVLEPAEVNAITYSFNGIGSEEPINGMIYVYTNDFQVAEAYAMGEIINGSVVLNLPNGNYRATIIPEIPYAYETIDNFVVNGEATESVSLRKAEVLLIDHDYSTGLGDEADVEDYYFSAIDNMTTPYNYTFFDAESKTFDPEQLLVNDYMAIVLFSGENADPVLPAEMVSRLENYLENGGNLFTTGQKLLRANNTTDLYSQYFKMEFAEPGPTVIKVLYVDPSDNMFTGEWSFLQYSGSSGADNQNDPDIITLLDPGVSHFLKYHPSNNDWYAAAYYEDATLGYKVVHMGVGFESLMDLTNVSAAEETRAAIMENILTEYFGVVTGVEDDAPGATLPEKFTLRNNYPNPFNPSTTIGFYTPTPQKIEVQVFNALGQKIATIANRQFTSGEHQVVWNGQDAYGKAVASGTYFYRVTLQGQSHVRKMLLIK